jgi:hypothetical protein
LVECSAVLIAVSYPLWTWCLDELWNVFINCWCIINIDFHNRDNPRSFNFTFGFLSHL